MHVVVSVLDAVRSKSATVAVAASVLLTLSTIVAQAQRVEITADAAVAKAPVTGRVFVFFSSTADAREPRLQGGSYGGSVPFFGLDVDAVEAPTRAGIVDAKALGFPYRVARRSCPAGDYYVQAMLVPYTQFSRADGHVIWVHNDQWEGQQFNDSPGNLVSECSEVALGSEARRRSIALSS